MLSSTIRRWAKFPVAIAVAVSLSGLLWTGAAAAESKPVVPGPYCPDHPGAPSTGKWIFTRVDNGRHIDVYQVPVGDGVKFVLVFCD